MSMSIKTRITLWYAMLFVIASALVFILLLAVVNYQSKNGIKTELIAAVENASTKVHYSNGELKVDDDFDFMSHGIFISIYDENRLLVYGKLPKSFKDRTLYDSNKLIVRTDDGIEWSIFDSQIDLGQDKVYIRGVASLSDGEEYINRLFSIALIMLPLVLAVALVGGYIITKRAFLPVANITQTANSIAKSGDLSQRIKLDGDDEIHMLARTFDNLFDKIEAAFEKEKRFTADASHELRTPLAVIVSQSEYAVEHIENAPDALSEILIQARGMSRMIDQLLTFARIDNGTQVLCMESVNISELFELVALQQSENAKTKEISVHCNIAPNLSIKGDEIAIVRMLINLVENAVRYGKEGGNIWLSLCESEHEVVGCVCDDGIGISRKDKEHIWERLYRAEASRGSEGCGLGLAMVKWIVEAHGGRITVESELGKGSSFTFAFPDKE